MKTPRTIRFLQVKTNKGFTLAELLIVIAIIGILSSVVIASLAPARAKGRDANRISEIKSMQLALELYYDANGNAYPASLSSLAPTFISSVPNDPQGGSYLYEQLASGADYHLGANLELDNDVLTEDSDQNGSVITSGDDATNCTGGTGFCYDVKP